MDHSEVKHLPKVDHTPAELDGASRRLLEAANLIEAKGLWQGGDSNGGTCMVLALNDGAKQFDRSYDEALARLCDSLGFTGWKRTDFVYAWNDSHTKDEVVAKMRAVALGL